MDLSNVPNNKHEQEVHIKGRKAAILELLEHFTDHDIDISVEIEGAMYNELEEINELLEGAF